MRKKEFKEWLLSSSLTRKAISNCISRCKTVETCLGVDLDKEYEKDYGQTVTDTLSYSAKDEKENKPIPAGFIFKEGTRAKNRFMDYRSAVKKYLIFCENVPLTRI